MATPTLERVLKERVAGLVGVDLEGVEAEIRRELNSPVALIQEMGGYIAGAGGKRLRPMLLLLAARLAGYVGPRGVRLACVVEMLHTATLIHRYSLCAISATISPENVENVDKPPRNPVVTSS